MSNADRELTLPTTDPPSAIDQNLPTASPAELSADDRRQEPSRAAPADTPRDTPAPIPTYKAEDLTALGNVDNTYGQELYIGPDGKKHFPDDPIGTQRTWNGSLAGMDGKFVTDTNPQTVRDIDHRAVKDTTTSREHAPDPSARSGPDAEVLKNAGERDVKVAARDQVWEKHLSGLVDKLSAHDVKLDKSYSKADITDLQQSLRPHLTAAENANLAVGLKKMVALNQEIKNTSERLGVSGGALTVAREFSEATPVTGGTYEKGTAGNLDRIIMIDERSRSLIVMEEKGVGSPLGSRMVNDAGNPTGPKVRAEQGSTDYLRHMLQHDNKLAATFNADPALRQRIDTLLSGPNPGTIRYLLVRTGKEGIVAVNDFKIDKGRLDQAGIRLPGTGRR